MPLCEISLNGSCWFAMNSTNLHESVRGRHNCQAKCWREILNRKLQTSESNRTELPYESGLSPSSSASIQQKLFFSTERRLKSQRKFQAGRSKYSQFSWLSLETLAIKQWTWIPLRGCLWRLLLNDRHSLRKRGWGRTTRWTSGQHGDGNQHH